MKIIKGRAVKAAARIQQAKAVALLDTAPDAAVARMKNLGLMDRLDAGVSIEEAEAIRASLYCTQCLHTARAHENRKCSVCGVCLSSRDTILKHANTAWQEAKKALKHTAKAASATPTKSAYHDQNKRVLQAIRRTGYTNTTHPEFVCECGHKAKLHSSLYRKGDSVLIGHICKGSVGSAPCGCTRSMHEASESGMKDAES